MWGASVGRASLPHRPGPALCTQGLGDLKPKALVRPHLSARPTDAVR